MPPPGLPQHLGMVGALPGRAWVCLVGEWLSPPQGTKDAERRRAVLELRRACRVLLEVVGQHCVGGAGWLNVTRDPTKAGLDGMWTGSLGRALGVQASLSFLQEPDQLGAVAAVCAAVQRGHMVSFAGGYFEGDAAAVVEAAEAVLVEASRKGQLLVAHLGKGSAFGWSVDAMAQLGAIGLSYPDRQTLAQIAGAGVLRHVDIFVAGWADMSILSSMQEVTLSSSDAVEDLSPLAEVPKLIINGCKGVKAVPAMRNDWLKITWSESLRDLSGLGGGQVGRLELGRLHVVEDVSAIGAMRPPPRTVVLFEMPKVQDVSMLAGVHRLEVADCAQIDEAATRVALEGRVGAIRWRDY